MMVNQSVLRGFLTTAYKVMSVLLAVLCVGQELSAQMAGDSAATRWNTIYLSAWGQGALYSLNYDHAWRTGANRMSISLGCAYFPETRPDQAASPSVDKYSLPVQWNFFHGKRNTMEHGLGLSLLNGWNAVGNGYDGTGRAHETSLDVFIEPIGYRLQPIDRGFFFRSYILVGYKLIEFNPAWKEHVTLYPEDDRSIYPWFGLDFGYSFKSNKK